MKKIITDLEQYMNMKKQILLLLLLGCTCVATSSALADDDCKREIPPSSIICTIDSSCDHRPDAGRGLSYQLSTSTESQVQSVNVDNGEVTRRWDESGYFSSASTSNISKCKADPALAAAAMKKLMNTAQQLKDAGVCKAIINNID